MQTVEDPFVVTGPPRSGTTFAQELLSSHRQIRIHGQSNMWPVVWQWYEELRAAGKRAAEQNEGIGLVAHFGGSDAQRCRRIVGRLWRDFISGYAEERPFWGWRAVWASADPATTDQVERLWPAARWIVCLREPFRAWQSQKGTYAKDLTLEESIRRWTGTVHFLRKSDPKRTFVLQVDLLSRRPAGERETAAVRLFDCLGVEIEPAVRQFVARWPLIHHRPKHSVLAPGSRQRMFEAFPQLAELMASMGYPPSGKQEEEKG